MRTLRPAAALALLLFAGVAGAADPKRYSVDGNFPVRLEDAFPADEPYLKLTAQYEESADGHGTTTVQPEVAIGLVERVDFHVLAPFLIGGDDRTGSGNLTFNVQALLLEQREGDPWPSVSVEGSVALPTGVNAEGVDTTVQLLATQTLSWAPAFDALHANGSWTHNAAPDATERDDAYTFTAGYSRLVLPDTVLVAAALWERTTSQGEEGAQLEFGLIQSLGEHVLLAAGVGIGRGDDAPDYTATLGLMIKR